MAAKAPDPLKTKKPVSPRGLNTYRAIAARLAALHPPIFLAGHIAESDRQGEAGYSTLDAGDSTLDGINFRAVDPRGLAARFQSATDKWGHQALVSLKGEPDHCPLKLSFGKTVGTGWREVWQPAPYAPPGAAPPESGRADNMFRMRFGPGGTPVRFTALHCAVHEIGGQCNVHVDESGFVLGLPGGKALTPDLYDHIVNELIWKTDFRDWLSGLMPNEMAARLVKEFFRRVAFTFPNALNGYADLGRRVNGIRRPQVPGDLLKTAGKLIAPVGVTIDAYDGDAFKVQVTGTAAGGDRSVTISISGEW